MATKRFAQGAELRIGNEDGPPETFSKIGNIQDITTPSATTDLIDVTDHDSPGGRKEYLAGLTDSDEMTFTINWDPSDSVHDDVESRIGDNANFELELNNAVTTTGTTYAFNAVLRKFVGRAPINGQHTAEITLKPSGAVTKTSAS